MKKTFPTSSSTQGRTTASSSEEFTFQDYIDEAEICCEQARLAGRQRRFKAACGLFTTATTLYRRALLLDGISYAAIEERLHHIEVEMSVYSELAKSMARPLLRLGTVSSDTGQAKAMSKPQ